jgi:hypothetical protein
MIDLEFGLYGPVGLGAGDEIVGDCHAIYFRDATVFESLDIVGGEQVPLVWEKGQTLYGQIKQAKLTSGDAVAYKSRYHTALVAPE